MTLETAIIMIVGVVALITLRLVLVVVGRDFRADHAQPKKTPKAATVYRQAGRNRHLLALPEVSPAALPESPKS